MKKILKKEELFYDLSRIATKDLLEKEGVTDLKPNLNLKFNSNLFESIAPIIVEVFTKDSKDADEYYSGFAICGRNLTGTHKSDFLSALIENIMFDILTQSYSINVEES